jgi:hypothetical protein
MRSRCSAPSEAHCDRSVPLGRGFLVDERSKLGQVFLRWMAFAIIGEGGRCVVQKQYKDRRSYFSYNAGAKGATIGG